MDVVSVEKVINDLLNYNGLKIVQCNDYFSFSLDSVLLPNFVTLRPSDKEIIDLGCGNAPVSMILSLKSKANITGVEIQKAVYDLAIESLRINNLESKIKIINDDIKNITKYFPTDSVDVVVSNPPYFKNNETSNINNNRIKAIARHEILISLEDIIEKSKVILKNGGFLAIVHRTDRFMDIISSMRKNNIEPKRVRFVYPKVGCESNLVLVEGVKNGKPGLKVLNPLIVHNIDGTYSDEVMKMFNYK